MAHEILLIESSETDRKDIGNFLESLGFKIHEASNSKDGMKMFDDLRPDLVIVEVLISPINGLKVCKYFKTEQPEWAKVIVTSKLYQSRAMARDAVDKYKADAYIEKPFAMGHLFDHIRNLIGAPAVDKKKAQEELRKKEKTRTLKMRPPASGVHRRPKPPSASNPDPAPLPSEHKPEPTPAPEPTPPPAPIPEPTPPPQPMPIAEPQTISFPAMDDDAFDDADDMDAIPDEPEPDLPTSGTLNRAELGKMLHTLFEEKVNGVLVLEYQEGTKHIYLVDGMTVFVQSNIRKESLGQILLNDGHLTQEQYQAVLEEAALDDPNTGRRKKIGSICVRRGFLTSKQLHEILTEQTAIKVANCFAWDRGDFKLDTSRTYPTNAPIFEATPSKILLLAYLSYYPVEALETALSIDGDKIVFAGKEDLYKDLAALLSDPQRSFVQGADGRASLSELVGNSSLPEFDALRLAYALLAMGVFRLGTVKRDQDLDEYDPDPAVDKPDADPNEKVATRINETYIRLENDDDFALFGIERGAPQKELNKSYKKLKKRFDPTVLEDDAPQALFEKLARINRRLDAGYARLSNDEQRRDYIDQLDQEHGLLNCGPAADTVTDPNDKQQVTLVAELVNQKGVYAMEQGNYARAVDFFKKACKLEPNTGEFFTRLGYAIYMSVTHPPNTLEDAVSYIETGLKRTPNDLTALRKLAEIQRHMRRYTDAIKTIEKALEIFPGDEDLELELGELKEMAKA